MQVLGKFENIATEQSIPTFTDFLNMFPEKVYKMYTKRKGLQKERSIRCQTLTSYI